MVDTARNIADLWPEKAELLEMLVQEEGEELICCPLSYGQERLWFLDQLEPGNPVYNLPIGVRLRGALQLSALERSLNEIIRRHEALRTRFLTLDGEPVQVIDPELELRLEVVDLSSLNENERETEALKLVHATAALPFDLTTGPLLRAMLLRLAAEEHILLLTMHHIISDGWSLGVLGREVGALYRAFTEGSASPLPALPVQYLDYAVWQREQLTSEFLAAQLSYWREQLSGAPAVLGLPTDHVRPAVKRYRGARERLELGAELTAALKALSREQGVTLFMVLLAAFKVLLWRYSGQADVVVGTPIANRQQSEIAGLIGFFVNTLVLRTSIEGSESFKNLLKRVREVCLGAYQHQDVPFEMVVEEMAVDRTMGQTPLFQVIFAMQAEAVVEMKGLQVTDVEVDSGTAKFDLTMIVSEDEGRLKGYVSYDTDLFEAGSIKRLVGHYERLLQELVRDREQAVGAVLLLGAEERQRLLIEWNQTSAPVPDSCLHELFEAQVGRTPEAVAVRFEERQLSYGELNRRANQLAHHLRGLGVGPEMLVGVLLERSIELVVALLGILKAGAAYLPLDAEYPGERLSFMLADAQVPVLLTQESLSERVPASSAQVLCIDRDWPAVSEGAENPRTSVSAENLAYVIYTSGSTGEPKGVLISHRAICNHLQWRQRAYPLSSSDRFLQKASVSFDISVWEIFGPLLAGSTLLLAKPGGQQESAYLTRLMADEQVTVAHFGPAMLQVWLQEAELEQCRSLKQVFCGGEPLTVEQRDSFFARLQAGLCHQYGPTEATVDALVWECQADDGEVIPLGRPIANTRAYVLDEALQPAPIGVAGELHLAGVGLARGYLKRAALTAEKFIPDPYSESGGERLYKTGDRMRYLADDRLEFLGRLDQQVKIRGFRVELGEVETLLEQHEEIKQAVVGAREAEIGGKVLVAYLVARQSEPPATAELRAYLKQRLPEYMVPAAFVFLSELPLTASGKVNRRGLPEVEASRAESGKEYEAPRTATEEILAGIWRELLRVERVGIYDNFFELGGHSLLAARMVSLVRESFSVELPLRSLFESPTVAGLAARIETMLAGEQGLVLPPIERVERVGHLPLSFAQQRLWFLDQLEPERAVYNISHCFQLSGTLEVPLLERAFNDVLSRHESLRTIFVNDQDGPVQVISPATKSSIPVEDLQGLSEAERETEVSRIASGQAQGPFDLSVGPLIRVRLLRLSNEEHLLLLTLHHIVCDGWSIAVLMQELVTLYQSYSNGEAAALEELPIQYADYAAWQRLWLQGAVLEQQLDYWKQQLAGTPAVMNLPTDRPRPPRQTFKGGRVRQSMSQELSEQLQQLSQRHGVTLFMILLAAFQLLLARYSGQEDVVVGTPIANRVRRELEGLIGFFANTLVMRTELSGNPSFAELLGRVREVCLRAYQHQDLPFEKLVEELRPERSLSHSPIFQVMFIMQNIQAAGFEQRLPNLQFKSQGVETEAAKFDLTLSVCESEAGLSFSLEYNTDLFNAETAERLVKHWINVLQAVSADPTQRISEVPLLSVEERQQLLSEWNQTAVEYVREKRVHELIAEQSALRPEAIAVICNDERLSYAELNGRANQLARYLQGRGVGTETVVGICVERSVEMMVGLLAVLKAGAAYLPLDPDYPAKRLEFMIADSQAPVLLTQARLQGRLTVPEQTRVVNIDHDWTEIAAENAAEVKTESEAGNLAYVIYTSGSTGEPKGVMISHGNVMNFVTGMDIVLGQQQDPGVWLAVTSISFDISVLELLWTLARGYEVVIHVGDKDNSIPALLERHGVTHMQCTPSLATVLAADGDSLRTLSSLDTLLLGGEALPTTLAQQLYVSSPASILNMYGPTETTIWSSTYRLTGSLRTIPIGSPIANTQLYVLDQHLSPVPVNVAGELYIGGEGVVRGYQQRPELTASRFIPDPFSTRPGARLYRTGDVARFRTDGLVEYLGRADHQLKLRGYRIELGEIEAVLATHAAVQECVVVAQGDADDVRLVAYVVMQAGQSLNESELRQHARERLPQYMVPSVFMVIDKMPLTANGKVNRRALPEVEASRAELGREYEAPRTETEETLVSIWREVLNVEQVGIHDNFFELGGHSLLAVRLLSRVRESFSVELPLRSLFETPTVDGLAALVETMLTSEQGLALPPIERVERIGHLPLSFAQQRLWFLNQLDQRSSFFNIHQAVRLKGVLNTAALEQSLNEVFRRHEALRTKFVTVNGLPVQVIEPPQPFSLTLEDLSTLPRAEQETKVLALSKEEAHHSFDLTQAPLLRIRLLRLDSEEHVVLLTMHHIISDGWSMAVFFREMSTLYAAFSEGMKPTLAELPIQYADYAVWQRNRLHGEALASELSYWKKQLAGAPPALDLPADYPTASQLSQGARYSVTIPDSLVKQLKRFSLSQEATPFIVLMAALKILLFRWTMQRDMVVGTVVANRERIETENLIGCFMNFLPVRTETSEEETGLQLLQRVKNTVLGMYAHHDCPFEKIVEAAKSERRPDQNPLYNVAFLLQNFPRTYDFNSTLEASTIPSDRDSSLLDLRFVAEEYQEAIKLWCEYRADLFEAETIKQLVEGYCATLEKLLSEPQLTLCSFTLPEELEARAKESRSRKQEQTIAIAATFTAEPVEDSLDFWMQELEIPTHCAFAPFNQVFQQLLQPSSLMATNRNGVNVILIRLQDWGRRSHDDVTETHSLVISPEEIERSVLEFIHAFNSAAESSTTPYLLCLCPNAPNILSEPQTAEFFQRMEELLAGNSRKSDGVYCVTSTELAATYPVLDYYDAERDQLGQVPYTPAFFTALGTMLARKVSALKRRPYKVIVLDCDETLWKGVCGEDGPLGVEIDAPRRALQEFMLAQYEQGMLLSLCSQNNEEDVLEVFKQHPGMALRPEHLAAWRINWRPKTENIKALAEELQLGLDSFIFVDNDPVICMQMQAECPEVLTLQLPIEAERVPKYLRHVWAFDHLKVTNEDRQRTELYQRNQKRERLRSDSLSLEDFLAAIELDIRISEMSPHQVARVAQLTQRTNQFNFTNTERSESELKNPSLETLVVEASDRFGDYGLVGVMTFESGADAIDVETFLLSCRALGRKLEHRMLARLGMIAYERRKQFVNVRLLRTTKNQPAQDFLSQVGMRFGELSDGTWNFKFPTEHLLTLDSESGQYRNAVASG